MLNLALIGLLENLLTCCIVFIRLIEFESIKMLQNAVKRLLVSAILIAVATTSFAETTAEIISISVPSAVAKTIGVYSAECALENGQLELDGDEVFKLWTDEGEEAYTIRAAFTCGDYGHMWCGAMGHCPIGLVINNTFYNTNKILKEHPNRISKDPDGIITYWMPNGVQLIIEQ
jgi:hypothetical protein